MAFASVKVPTTQRVSLHQCAGEIAIALPWHGPQVEVIAGATLEMQTVRFCSPP
jgi:hypothetical protein